VETILLSLIDMSGVSWKIQTGITLKGKK